MKGKRYKSNNGRGPLTAEIVSFGPKWVELLYWKRKREYARRCRMTRQFFESKACGWKEPSP